MNLRIVSVKWPRKSRSVREMLEILNIGINKD